MALNEDWQVMFAQIDRNNDSLISWDEAWIYFAEIYASGFEPLEIIPDT
jgi:hypothetical protein